MLRDWGSWDATFNAVTAEPAQATSSTSSTAAATRTSACRCRAAARFRSRRRSARWCRATATCWCSNNGAYCKRIVRSSRDDGPRGRRSSERRGRSRPRPPMRRAALVADPSITHVGADPLRDRRPACSTAAGDRRRSCARHGKGLIVDAMSSFARAADRRRARCRSTRWSRRAASASRACPAWASCSSRKAVLERARRQRAVAGDGPARPVRLHGEDRRSGAITPPTHVVAALRRGARPVRGRGRAAGAARALHATTARR